MKLAHRHAACWHDHLRRTTHRGHADHASMHRIQLFGVENSALVVNWRFVAGSRLFRFSNMLVRSYVGAVGCNWYTESAHTHLARRTLESRTSSVFVAGLVWAWLVGCWTSIGREWLFSNLACTAHPDRYPHALPRCQYGSNLQYMFMTS